MTAIERREAPSVRDVGVKDSLLDTSNESESTATAILTRSTATKVGANEGTCVQAAPESNSNSEYDFDGEDSPLHQPHPLYILRVLKDLRSRCRRS